MDAECDEALRCFKKYGATVHAQTDKNMFAASKVTKHKAGACVFCVPE